MSILRKLGACPSGAEWADSQESYKAAWETCERGDWMLWIAKKQGVDLKKLTMAKVECAELVKHLMTDERSLSALAVARSFAAGRATREELSAAADAAAAAYAARKDTLKKAADLVRKHIAFDDLGISQ